MRGIRSSRRSSWPRCGGSRDSTPTSVAPFFPCSIWPRTPSGTSRSRSKSTWRGCSSSTRHVLFDLERDVPEGVLGQMEHGKKGATLVGVESLEPPHLGQLLRRELRIPRIAHAKALGRETMRVIYRALPRSC